MNIALLLAGGSGTRTEQDIPKQFFNVYEKPIIIYTLEAFQRHPDIDGIIVSCLEGWHEILRAYAKEADINKLKWIVGGGENGQASARNALRELQDVCHESDIVVIHDAIRPMVSAEIISDCIVKCRQYGSGLAAMRCQETIIETQDGIKGDKGISRSNIMRVQTPQAYRYRYVMDAHERALQQGITDAVYTNTLMIDLGETLYFSKGSEKNLKITTMEDVEIFKALYRMEKEDWVK
ncbi:2-C-methyl-D-erythritol 4-phosphate cytidylyltransferase [bacterium C-53]|nr:2-C-methyl-D-erythritol 4-phosphate cytidylyltransferase [Lachnospiraceae bacterium]NBI04462.1 2-C-methyl-D-erythritol 4-phosphate cytidylyltransferase [Lachnospiraceae bacterium]RKJ08135.1 2-C-methyl-D-erythritol 4-phosphate cytidylyltransferase [bacterium C-53]